MKIILQFIFKKLKPNFLRKGQLEKEKQGLKEPSVEVTSQAASCEEELPGTEVFLRTGDLWWLYRESPGQTRTAGHPAPVEVGN